jgi:fumarate reductase flavoprotein subunit
MKKYTDLDLRKNIFPIHNSEKYGDGIRMAWAVGAAEEGMGVLNFSFGGPVGPGIKASGNISASVRQPTLWVNQDGVRFCDESIVQNCIYTGNAQARQKGGCAFRVFDENTKRYFMEEGIDIGVGMLFVPPRTRLTDFDEEVEKAVAKGNRNVFVGHSISELADMMGIDDMVFTRTVDQYNRFCEKGHDDQFAKDRCYLREVKSPKFYGFKCYLDFTGTTGGIRINENIEVLDENNMVIPGLYAVGNDAGGLYGDSYDMISAGAAVGFAINSGRLAGESALRYLHP